MFLKKHLLPCSSWKVKIHHVHEFSFCLMFLKNLSLAFGSWIFILPDFLKNHSLAWLMNFGFVWCSWKITHLLGSSWFMLFENPFNCLVHNFWFWMVLLRITLTWLFMLNNENAIFLKIMCQLGLWILWGFHGAFENHFACVWINLLERRISWSWESWAINLLKANYHSLWLMEFCENKIMFLKFTWFACELILWKCNSLENWNPFYFTRFIN